MTAMMFRRIFTHRVSSINFFRAKFSVKIGTKEHIDSLVKETKLVVFMKGTPEQPRCGFSNGVVQILDFHGVYDYDAYNVLEDEDLRQGIKEYTNWPTIPQVFIDGEFVGGVDLLLEMHKNGELVESLLKVGIRSRLLDLDKNEEKSSSENNEPSKDGNP